MYKNTFVKSYELFTKLYRIEARKNPSLSIEDKTTNAFHEWASYIRSRSQNAEQLIVMFSQEILQESRHFFIEDNELIEFLKDTKLPKQEVIEDTLFHIMGTNFYDVDELMSVSEEVFYEELTRDEDLASLLNVNQISPTTKGFTINLHTVEFAISMQFFKTNVDKLYLSYCTSVFQTAEIKSLYKKSDVISAEDFNTFKFCINFLLYLNTFKECIENRLPKGVSPKTNKGKTIRPTSEVIVPKEERKTGIPFYRSGCFVTYTSERYKKARFQTRWRNSTFVNGEKDSINTIIKENVPKKEPK